MRGMPAGSGTDSGGRLAYKGGDRGVSVISRGCMTVSGLQKVAYLVLLVLIVAAASGLLGGAV